MIVAAVEPAGALDPRGPVASEIAELWWLMLILGAAIFALFLAALLWAVLRRPDAATSGAVPETPRSAGRWIVLGGVALPVVTVAVVLGFTVDTMRTLPDEGGPDALVVEVTGHRWWWSFEYPDLDVVTATELHVPVGRPVELRLRSADVIHSFWVPALAGKLDALPEDVNTLVLEVDEPGRLSGVCAEFCGLQHARMDLVVVAETAEEFASWAETQRQPVGATGSSPGEEVFLGRGCADCHTVRGTAAAGTSGPDLTHLASRASLGGATLPLDRENLEAWVTDPHRSKTGVEMPATDLSADELEVLVDYLEGLR